MNTPALHYFAKIQLVFAGLIFASACLAPLRAAPAAITTSYPSTAFQLAAKYAGDNPTSEAKRAADLEQDDSFKAFLASEGLKPAGKMAHAVAALVMSLRDAAKDANDEGIETDPSKPAYRLSQQEAAAVVLNVSADTLGGRAAPSSSHSAAAATADSKEPVKEQAAEVLAADRDVYDELKLQERKLKAKMDELRESADATDASAEKKADATTKLANLEPEWNENQAHQALLRAQLAADNAKKAADKADENTKPALTAAAEKAKANSNQAKAAYDALHSLLTGNQADFSNIQAYFHTGVTLLNPYHIKSTDATATTPASMSVEPASSTDTNAFLEFVYSNRWAWNAKRVKNEFPLLPTTDDLKWFTGQIDVQTRLGYTFASDGAKNANTLVGSGNFNGEVAVGYPFMIFRSNDLGTNFSVGLEGVYGAVTDRSALRAHPREFGGFAYTTSFKDRFEAKDNKGNPRSVLLHFRTGRVKIDTVQYVDPAVSREIFRTNGDLPKFERKQAWAFETELLYPIKTSTFVTFASRVYTEISPNPWSVQIGITTSFGDLLTGFFK